MAEELRTQAVVELQDRLTRPLKRIQNAMQRLRTNSGLTRLAAAGRGVSDAFGNAVGKAGRLAGSLGLLGGAAAGAAWGLGRLVGGVTSSAENVLELSNRLGVGVKWLQRWQGAAQRFGVQNEALRDGIKELSLRVDEAVQTGSGPAAEALQRLGFSRKELAGATDDVEGLFNMVRERIRSVQNASARQRIADELFGGQGGEQLVEMLGASQAKIDEMMSQVRAAGGILSRDELERARQLNNTWRNFTASLDAVRKAVVIDLLPQLNRQLQRMAKYLQNNAEQLTGRIIQGLKDFWGWLETVGGTLKWAADLLGGWPRLLGAIAAIAAGPLIAAIASLGSAIVSLGIAIGFTPIGWFLGAIAALAGAATLIYRNWEGISRFFGDKFAAVEQAFKQDLILGVLTALRDFNPVLLVTEAINGLIEYLTGVDLLAIGSQWMRDLWDGMKSGWRKLQRWFESKVESLTSWLPDWFKDLFGGGDDKTVTIKGLDQLRRANEGGPSARMAPAALGPESGASALHQGNPVFGGRAEVRIGIDQEGKARVRDMQGDGVDVTTDTGSAFSGGR